jgi:hypothetical protein
MAAVIHCAVEANNRWSGLFEILNKLELIRDLDEMKLPHKAGGASHLFDTLLAGIDFRQATDPKDRIYGALGLLPDHKDDDLLRPDYSLSVAQVYGRAGFKIIKDSENLRLLSYADRQCGADDLLSWCHDFAEKAPFNPEPYE